MEEFNVIEYLRDLAKTTEGFTEIETQDYYNAEFEKLSEEQFQQVVEMLEDESCDCEKSEELSELECYEKELDIKATELALAEEYKRIEKQDVELIIPECAYDTDVFVTVENECSAIANGFRILLDAGVDYANAIQLASNAVQNKNNLELAKHNVVQTNMSQI